jgi:hypothetical protein
MTVPAVITTSRVQLVRGGKIMVIPGKNDPHGIRGRL